MHNSDLLSSLYGMYVKFDSVDDHLLPNFSSLTSMNEFTSFCSVSPFFNVV